MQFVAAGFAKRKLSNCQIWVYNQLFHTVSQAFKPMKKWKRKIRNRKVFKKHVKCSKTVNEKNEKMTFTSTTSVLK